MTQVYRRLNRIGRRKFVNGGDSSSAYDAIIGEAPTWTNLKRPGINNTGWSPKAGGTAGAGNTAGVVGGVAALGTGLIDAIDTPNNYGNPSTVATTGTGALGGAAAGAAAGSVVPGIGTAVGAVVGGVVGGVSGWLRGKKLRRKEAEMFRQSNDARRKYDEAVSRAIMQDPGLVQGYKGATYFRNGGRMVPVGRYATGGPIDEEKNIPKGYKPLTQQQRGDWNKFVRYLNRDLKVGGSKDLDDRTKDTGIGYLNAYRKANPDFSVTPDMVPYVQYEFQQLKNTNSLPNVRPQGRVKSLVQDYFNTRDVSPVDGWIGSLTSRQGYPEVTEFSDDPQHRYWGLDYEGASNFEQQVWNQRQGKPDPHLARIPSYQDGGKLQRPVDKSLANKRYKDLYGPVEDRLNKAVEKIGYEKLPKSTQQMLSLTIGQFDNTQLPNGQPRNIPPMDDVLKGAQEKFNNLTDEQIEGFLKTDWSAIKTFPQLLKNKPKGVGLIDLYKYYNEYNKLKKAKYTFESGGRLKHPELSEKYMTGGYAKPINSNATELIGNSHAEGGIQIPSMNAEVEDGETTAGDFVFSKELGFARLHRPIAKSIGKIEKKPQTPDRVNALKLLRAKEQRLANAQEQYKMEQGIV